MPSRSHYVAVLFGVAYGIGLRILLGLDSTRDLIALEGLVSFSFLVLVPLGIGFATTFLADSGRAKSLKWAIFGPWISIFCFLAVSVVLLLEGAVCVAIALPLFLALSSLGGVAAWWFGRLRARGTTTLCVVLAAPLLASPIERTISAPSHIASVESTIRIAAPPSVIWSNIVHVDVIDSSELSFSLTRLMGIPQPLEARMENTESGWVRNTRWAKGVEFREVITDSIEYRDLTWVFDFPPSAVPEGVLDDHVLIGGEYFELLDGGYNLRQLPDGSTDLTLTTRFRVSARPSLYARLWAHVVVADFHRIILKLIGDRSEVDAA